jgi:hypothetical protein
MARVDAGSDAAIDLARPPPDGQRALDLDRRLDRALRRLEHREVLVAVRVDAPAAAAPPRVAHERPDVLQQRRVPIAEPFGQPRRPLDVGHEERH